MGQPSSRRSNEAISQRHRICRLVILSRPVIVASAVRFSDRGITSAADRRSARAGSAEFRFGSLNCTCLSASRCAQYLFLWVSMTSRPNCGRRALRSLSRTSPHGRRSPTKPPPDTRAAGSKRLFWSGILRERLRCRHGRQAGPAWLSVKLAIGLDSVTETRTLSPRGELFDCPLTDPL